MRLHPPIAAISLAVSWFSDKWVLRVLDSLLLLLVCNPLHKIPRRSQYSKRKSARARESLSLASHSQHCVRGKHRKQSFCERFASPTCGLQVAGHECAHHHRRCVNVSHGHSPAALFCRIPPAQQDCVVHIVCATAIAVLRETPLFYQYRLLPSGTYARRRPTLSTLLWRSRALPSVPASNEIPCRAPPAQGSWYKVG